MQHSRSNMAAPFLWFCMHANICTICGVLMGSLYIQVVLHEFPCPLCMTQRICMMLCALGQCFILSRLSSDGELHWKDVMLGNGMTLFAALAGSAMAIRQILLHIVPPDPGYGSAVFGLHLYTWALFVFCAELAAVGLALLLMPRDGLRVAPASARWTKRVFLLFGLIVLAFGTVTFIEEGFHLFLPDNPVSNRLFEDLGLRPPTPALGS